MKKPLPSPWPALVGLLSLALTFWLWLHECRSEDARLKAAFEFGLRQAVARVEQRVAGYGQILRGVQGLMSTGESIDQARFERHAEVLLAGSDSTGLQTLVYGPLLVADALPGHLRARHDAGLPDYAVHPSGLRDAYAPATYVAPAAGVNRRVFGYDPHADAARRGAMLRARDSGAIAVTPKIRLFIERQGRQQDGFLMFLPLYAKGAPVDSLADRRAHLTGWVWGAFRLDDMMSSLYGEGLPGLALSLYDGVGDTPGTLMFASTEARAPARFEATEFIGLPGHSWTLQVRSLPEFDRLNGQGIATTVAVTGTVLSVLLALLTHLLVSGRSQADARAQAMTRELRESETRYRRIVETSQEGIWMTDAAGRINFVNPTMIRLLGHPADDILGRPLADFAGDPSRAARLQGILEQRADITRPGAQQQELGLRRRDGSELWVSMSVSPISDAGGAHAGALGMAIDVTERRQAEARRSLLEAQLRESQKMEAIGTLAGGIAHDFNNILAVILGNVASARQEAAAGHSPLPSLRQIDKAAVRARALVQQILAFSRMQPQALVSQALRPLVEDAVTLLRSTLPAQVELVVRLSDTPLYAGADATQVQQVLMNLCTNAWHALRGGAGRIGVTLEPVTLDAEAAQSLTGGIAPGDCAHLAVSDTGIGMDEATRARVFEPFFTTKRVGQGTGLGLSVVHGIVSAHQGGLRVESSPGRGSTFHVYLPLRAPPPPSPEPAPMEADASPGRGERVLYVDDDPAMLLMVEALLARAGYTVVAMGSAREALHTLQALQSEQGHFDVIVTDYNMPELTGLDIAAAARRARPGVPVIITSGFIADDLRSAAQALGVRSLLQKEYTLEQLVELIEAALERRTA